MTQRWVWCCGTQRGSPTEEVQLDLQVFANHQSEITVEAGCPLTGNRVVVLTTLQEGVLEELHSGIVHMFMMIVDTGV